MSVDNHSQAMTAYDNAKYWIAQYETVDDVKQYIDKAAAVQEYARRSADTDMECQAARARIRAERKCGELLKDMEMAKRGKGADKLEVEQDDRKSGRPKTLKELGVTKDQSSKYQKLSGIDADEFEDIINFPASKPTTKGVLDMHHDNHHEPEPEPQFDKDGMAVLTAVCFLNEGLQGIDIVASINRLPALTRDHTYEQLEIAKQLLRKCNVD